LALGTSELSPLELIRAYSVFATGGQQVNQITPILKIEDKNGNLLADFTRPQLEQVYSSRAIRMLNNALVSAVEKGTGQAARLTHYKIAGKTGTTSDHRDAWFIGYIPELVTLVWAGNDNNAPMIHATGGNVAAPIWQRYMSVVIQ